MASTPIDSSHLRSDREYRINSILDNEALLEALRKDNIHEVLSRVDGVTQHDIIQYLASQSKQFDNQILQSHNNNIAVAGAGRNIAEARRPAILERNGTKVGFLAYLSIVFPGLIAEEDTPGCVPLRASHYYKQMDFQPGTPPLIVTELFPEDKNAMEEDIRKLRPQVDVLVVSTHAGVHFVPATVAMYQKEAAYLAIDTGADLVLQHHAHILKGIEVYNGKAIFYGLGNFALEHSKMPAAKKKTGGTGYRNVLGQFYRIKPIPGWETYHYLPDARMTMIAKAYIQDNKIRKVCYIPTYVNPQSEPEVVTRKDPRAQEVFDYVNRISEAQELNVGFSWDGDEVLVNTGREQGAVA